MKLEDMRKCLNFRDLGGYKTTDGRQIASGHFYRCGALGDLNEEELAFVRSLGIKHVFDFRSEFEADDLPDPEIGAEYHQFNALLDEHGKQVQFDPEGIENAAKQKDAAVNFLEMMYGRLPFCNAYKVVFKVIEKKETPILFHCSAGKDRTGIMAVLILLALGVDEETALDDYELTNEYRAELIERFMERVAPSIGDDPVKLEQMKAFEGVLRSSAEYSLTRIKNRYENYPAFFEAEFGLDEKKINELRSYYLRTAE